MYRYNKKIIYYRQNVPGSEILFSPCESCESCGLLVYTDMQVFALPEVAAEGCGK